MFIGLDIEAASTAPQGGLRPQIPGGRITTIAIGNGNGWNQSMYEPTADAIQGYIQAASAIFSTRDFCTYNGVFDLGWLYAKGVPLEFLSQYRWYDGLLLHKRYDRMQRVLSKEYGYGLKEAALRCYGIPNYGEGVSFDIPEGTPESDPRVQKLLSYNAKDAVYTASLCESFYAALDKKEKHSADNEAEILPDVAASWVIGQPVDVAELRKVAVETSVGMNAAVEKLGVPGAVLNSGDKLRDLLFGQWGLTPVKQTKGGKDGANKKDATDKYTMIKLATTDARVKEIYSYRKYRGRWGKFVQGTVDALKSNGCHRSYAQPVMAGTYTGRWTYASKVGQKIREEADDED